MVFKSDFAVKRIVKHASLQVSVPASLIPQPTRQRHETRLDGGCTQCGARQGIKENYEMYRRHLHGRLRMEEGNGEGPGEGWAAGGKVQAFGHFGQAQPGNGARPAAVTALLLALLGAALLAVLIACYLVRQLARVA